MNNQVRSCANGAALAMLFVLVTLSTAASFQERLNERWQASYDQITLETIHHKVKVTTSSSGTKTYDQVTETTPLKKTTPLPANPTADDHHYQYANELHVNIILRRTQALIDELNLAPYHPDLGAEQAALNQIKAQVTGPNSDKALFFTICALQRKIAMKNPLLDFDSMIFSGKWTTKPQFHSQQMAFFDIPDKGNSLYKVSGFKEGNPQFTDMLLNPTVINGRHKGKVLSNNKGANWEGHAGVFTPEINYEGTKVAFAWAAWCSERKDTKFKYDLKTKYRIFEMNLDGTNLRMVSDFGEAGEGGIKAPNMDEYDPTYLPNGRMLFVSERHNGGQRCGNTATSGNMYTMQLDGGNDGMGSDFIRISWHETNERSPVVDYNGKIVYSRWDYVDRHAFSAQSMWLTNPDGSDPRAYHGNYVEDDKPFHVMSECDIRPIPGSPGKYMAIAGGHHEAYWGNLAVIDINKRAKFHEQIRWFYREMATPSDNHISDVLEYKTPISKTDPTKVDTTFIPWGRFNSKGRLFTTPYPLNESFVIVGEYDEVLLLDKFRNEILLFSTKELFDIAVHSPLPIKSRTKEVQIAPVTCQGKGCNLAQSDKATISVIDVRITDTPWPSNIKIQKLRVCQLVPRPKKPWDTERNEWWGWSDGALLKAVIGTVPVELDGSAYFQAPIEKEIFFQVIDSTGMAVTSMLSGTYVHPGEHLTCIGCHEDKWGASPALKETNTHAFQKGPAPITPEVSGSYPLTYARLVYNEVFKPKCWEACHKTSSVAKAKEMDFSYWNWKEPLKCGNGGVYNGPCAGAIEKFVTYYGSAYDGAYTRTPGNMLQMGISTTSKRSRSVPMEIGARRCKLIKDNYLEKSHYNVTLTDEQKRRVYLWLDLNAQDLGTYQLTDDPDYTLDRGWKNSDNQGPPYTRQRKGDEVVWPSWEHSGFDQNNVTGVQKIGKEFPPYYPDKQVSAGALATPYSTATKLLVRGTELVLSGVPAGQIEITLFNLAGRAVMHKNIATNALTTLSLGSTQALGAGRYIARIRSNGTPLSMANRSILITQ
jgi:hypothetical protein